MLCDGETVWCSAGRSPATRQRAADAGMTEVGSLEEMIERTDLIVSICPPGAAVETADAVAAARFSGTYADLNAIAPGTARRLGERFEHFVDGGIIGPPAKTPGATRLYLSGPDARWWPVAGRRRPSTSASSTAASGAASAVKTCFAAWTKGSAALLLTVRALARAEDVEDPLLSEWATSIPDLVERSEHAATGNGPKAWRFVGEMHEISASLADVGLPDWLRYGCSRGLRTARRLAERPTLRHRHRDRPPPPHAPRLTRALRWSPSRGVASDRKRPAPVTLHGVDSAARSRPANTRCPSAAVIKATRRRRGGHDRMSR